MTISTPTNSVVAQGNGVATAFNFSFIIPNASDLFVYYTNTSNVTVQIPSSQYSVTGIGQVNGGTVTYPLSGSPIPSGSYLEIVRTVPYLQLVDIVDQSGFYPAVIEGALDNLTMQTQQLANDVVNAITIPPASVAVNLVLPTVSQRANNLVGFDAEGNVVSVTPTYGAVTTAAQINYQGALLSNLLLNSMQQIVSSVLNLRAVSKAIYTQVFVSGYLSEGDGGGGNYFYNPSDTTSADNGGTIIVGNDGGRWHLLLHNGSTSIEQWGAVGDGSTNDYAAINAALQWTMSNKKTLNFSSKVYAVASQIVIGNGSSSAPSSLNNFSIIGVAGNAESDEVIPTNTGTKLLWTGGSTASPVVIVEGPIIGINISGIEIDCNSTAQAGIVFNHPLRCNFSDIKVINNINGFAISHLAYTAPTNVVIGSSQNTFNRVNNNNPGAVGSGFLCGGSVFTAPYLDVARNIYSNCAWIYDNTSSSNAIGLELAFCDANTFIECSVAGFGAGSNGYSLFFNPPTGTQEFPGGNTFLNCPILGPKTAGASWAPGDGNGFFPYPTGDGEAMPTSPVNFNSNYGVTNKGEWFGGLSFGVGNTAIKQHLSVTASLTFGAVAGASGAAQTMTVTGASVGDTCIVSYGGGAFPAGGVLGATVISSNTVEVVWGNYSVTSFTPTAAATYRVDVWKH